MFVYIPGFVYTVYMHVHVYARNSVFNVPAKYSNHIMCTCSCCYIYYTYVWQHSLRDSKIHVYNSVYMCTMYVCMCVCAVFVCLFVLYVPFRLVAVCDLSCDLV